MYNDNRDKNITIILSGSVACFKACILISNLKQHNFNIQTIATKSALKFIGEATLEAISGKTVLTQTFEKGSSLQHISIIDWSDLFIIYPASANTINKIKSGIADDLVGAISLANNFRKPLWIAPAMNTNMLNHPATQNSLNTLKDWGATILPTEEGTLACGAIGKGRIFNPESLFKKIEEQFSCES